MLHDTRDPIATATAAAAVTSSSSRVRQVQSLSPYRNKSSHYSVEQGDEVSSSLYKDKNSIPSVSNIINVLDLSHGAAKQRFHRYLLIYS